MAEPADAWCNASAILAPDTGKELHPGEQQQIRLPHPIYYGWHDFVPLKMLPAAIPAADNGALTPKK